MTVAFLAGTYVGLAAGFLLAGLLRAASDADDTMALARARERALAEHHSTIAHRTAPRLRIVTEAEYTGERAESHGGRAS